MKPGEATERATTTHDAEAESFNRARFPMIPSTRTGRWNAHEAVATREDELERLIVALAVGSLTESSGATGTSYNRFNRWSWARSAARASNPPCE